MVGPHRTTAADAIGPAARGSELSENLGLRRGLGRIFGSSEGVTVSAAARRSWLLGSAGEVEHEKPRKRKKEVGKEKWRRLEKAERHRRRAVESVGIADPAALCGVDRRRNAPPPTPP